MKISPKQVQQLFSRQKLASALITPVKQGDPKAKIPVDVNGVRCFPPTIDNYGNITYYREFPSDYKPYSYNYHNHGWMIASQLLLWGMLFHYENLREKWTEAPRLHK